MQNELNTRRCDSLEFDVVFYLMDQRRKKIDKDLKVLCEMGNCDVPEENKKVHEATNIWSKIFNKKSSYKRGEVKWKI